MQAELKQNNSGERVQYFDACASNYCLPPLCTRLCTKACKSSWPEAAAAGNKQGVRMSLNSHQA
eukprot:1149934-Pelagomonas_calceolata.AAC.2